MIKVSLSRVTVARTYAKMGVVSTGTHFFRNYHVSMSQQRTLRGNYTYSSGRHCYNDTRMICNEKEEKICSVVRNLKSRDDYICIV